MLVVWLYYTYNGTFGIYTAKVWYLVIDGITLTLGGLVYMRVGFVQHSLCCIFLPKSQCADRDRGVKWGVITY